MIPRPSSRPDLLLVFFFIIIVNLSAQNNSALLAAAQNVYYFVVSLILGWYPIESVTETCRNIQPITAKNPLCYIFDIPFPNYALDCINCL